MVEITKNENFVGYEYKDVTVGRDIETVYADSYPQFGWALEGTTPSIKGFTYVTLKFKRDRKIRNKAELTRLQRQFESCVNELQRLENSKFIEASAVAYIIGIVGTAFMAGAVFSYLAGKLLMCIIMALPGFIGWVIPYFCYLRIRNKRTDAISPLIDQKYDEIYEVCEKAHGLLN